MNTEFTVNISSIQLKIYMQSGFFNHDDLTFPMHKHQFDEVHIILTGTACLKCNNNIYTLKDGDVILIPSQMLHEYSLSDKNVKRISFFISGGTHYTSIQKTNISTALLPLISNEIKNYVLTDNESKLKALLAYICSDFFESNKSKKSPITNRKIIIEDFFSKNYNRNVCIMDLAKELGLSTKQTQREVKKITGNTFTDEIVRLRINAAVILMKTTNIPLTKISELVGYSSYCGFYKAYKKLTSSL